MNMTLQELMRAATQLTQSGRLQNATEAIQNALRGAATAGAVAGTAHVWAGAGFLAVPGAPLPTPSPWGLEGGVVDVDAHPPVNTDSGTGEFSSGTHTHAALTRRFKLYQPPGLAGKALPLVVMLHGCTQDPDDFAAGTAMNERAREQGFFVLYPQQATDANQSRC